MVMSSKIARTASKADTGVIVTPTFAFGINPKVPILHGQNGSVYYAVGPHVVCYDPSSREMSFLSGCCESISGLAITTNRKYLACVEHIEGGSQQVSVYNLQHNKCVRTLQPTKTAAQSSQIVQIAFSENGKYLVMQCGEPEWWCLCWRWYSGKVVATAKTEMPVSLASINPWDQAVLALISNDHIRLMHLELDNEVYKLSLSIKQEDERSWVAHAWLVGGILAVCDDLGKISFYHSGSLRDTISVPLKEDESLRCIASKGRGFVIGGSLGTLASYEAAASRTKEHLYSSAWRTDVKPLNSDIVWLSISQAEDAIAMLTSNHEIIFLEIEAVSSEEENKVSDIIEIEEDTSPFVVFCGGFNDGRITGMDICAKVAFLAICEEGRKFFLWNYFSRECILKKQLLEDPLCVSLHPSGVQVLIGMHNKLRLFGIWHNDLLPLAEFPVKKCIFARFSQGGHQFAAVGRANSIHIYNAYTHQLLAMMKGHVSTVTDIKWASNDRFLVSVGAGGACYTWDMTSFSRIQDKEHVDKKCTYHSVTVGSKRVASVARTYDGRIQHIENGAVHHEVSFPKGEYLPLELIGEDNVLLVADTDGSVVSRPWPRDFPVENSRQFDEERERVKVHCSPITHMKVSADGSVLITASADGFVMVSSLAYIVQGCLRESGVRNEGDSWVLIDPQELVAHREKMKELAMQVFSVKTEAEYNAIRDTQTLRDALGAAESERDRLKEELEEKAKRLDTLEQRSASQQIKVVKELEVAHLNAAEELESLYEKRLTLEGEKFKRLMAAKDDLQFKMEEDMKMREEEREKDLEKVHQTYQERLDEEEQKHLALLNEKREMEKYFNEVLVQTELDLEDYSDKIGHKIVENNLAAKDRESKLKVDNSIMKRNTLRLKSDKAQDSQTIRRLNKESRQMQETLNEQKITIRKLKEEIKERDDVISSNYHTIQALRRKVQELEKHKYVLSHKAERYQEELAPQTQLVKDLKERLELQDEHFASEVNHVRDLHRCVVEKDSFISSLKVEIIDLKEQLSVREYKLKDIAYDLVAVMDQPDDRRGGKKSERQVALDEFYKKYYRSDVRAHEEPTEEDLKRTLNLVESRNTVLERKMEKREVHHATAVRGRIHENVELLKQIADARRDNKDMRKELTTLRHQFSILDHKYQELLRERSEVQPNATEQAPLEDVITENFSVGGDFLPSSVSLSKAPLTRPSSGTDTETAPTTSSPSTRLRPQSAVHPKQRPASAPRNRSKSAGGKETTIYGLRRSYPSTARQRPMSAVERPLRVASASHGEIQRIAVQLARNADILEYQNEQLSNLKALMMEGWGAEEEEEVVYVEGQDNQEKLGDASAKGT